MAAWESGESGHAHPKGLLPNGNSYLPDAPEAIKHVKFGGRLLIVGELIAEPLPVHLQVCVWWVCQCMSLCARRVRPHPALTSPPTPPRHLVRTECVNNVRCLFVEMMVCCAQRGLGLDGVRRVE